MPAPPRKPIPLTETVALFKVRVLATSSARIPPVDPCHGVAVGGVTALSVADRYCGTSTSWGVLCPAVAEAAADVYPNTSPPPTPAPRIGTEPPLSAQSQLRTHSCRH